MAVYKDNNSKWYISINYKDAFGRDRHTTKRGFQNQTDALEFEANFLAHKATPNIKQSSTYHDSF